MLNIDIDISKSIPSEVAVKYRSVPICMEHNRLTVYIDKLNIEKTYIKDELEFISGHDIHCVYEEGKVIDLYLKEVYPDIDNKKDNRLQANYYNGQPENFLSDLIVDAKNLKSSDIHIETYENDCRVRIRVDGLLITRYLIERKQYPSLINKIKITANLDIAEKRLPQDGRIFFQKNNDKIDIRVSIVPTLHGEKVVLRLLGNDLDNINLEELGFSSIDYKNYLEGIKKPNGIILISGPTGSGKTTTLYGTLKLLNQSTRNILTIEDPIEYTLKGINQVQVRENIGLTFSAALRTFLRQDPDIIMLGEIRDAETANMAIRAALTGHLVLSTIHTNSAWGTISRLIDMNIPPFLIANTLNLSVAQRLVRLLCKACKEKTSFDTSAFPLNYIPNEKIEHHYIPHGCPACFNTGYRKRTAIYEVISIDVAFVEEIKKNTSSVINLLKEKKIKTLSDSAFELLKSGETSLEEIYPLLMS